MMKTAATVVRVSESDPVESELARAGGGMRAVLLLLQRLAKARALQRDCGEILGELSATVLHLHAHTKGLDWLIDELLSG